MDRWRNGEARMKGVRSCRRAYIISRSIFLVVEGDVLPLLCKETDLCLGYICASVYVCVCLCVCMSVCGCVSALVYVMLPLLFPSLCNFF